MIENSASHKIESICSITGNTPLIRISDRIYAKLETYNPTGSVKDRMISYVVREALLSKEIDESTILCDATSGNTGIALSMISAAIGVPCYIFMPKNMSEERKQMMRAFGAKIIDAPNDDFSAAIEMRDMFIFKNKKAWSPMQFSNQKNVECHEKVTAPEIHAQVKALSESWGAFIHGSGTGGTIEGIRRHTKALSANTRICMVKPDSSPHGIQGIADGKEFLAKEADMHAVLEISTEEAISRAKQFAKDTGILVGISSGANIAASERWAQENRFNGIVVTMLCDRGERYLSIY